jgi:hypothetical protein
MKMIHCPLGLLSAAGALLLGFSGAAIAHEDEKETATFAYKSYPKWTINLPKETFSPIAAEIPIGSAGGTGFHAEMDGTALAVDTNADGKVDTKAKGVASFMTLKGKNAGGREFQYSVRLVNQSGWKFAASGVMAGKVKGVQLRLIDQNNNGKYNDVGEDAMIVGQGDAACFLSRVVNLDGELYSIEVGEDGSQVSATPFTGESGTLNLDGSFTTQGILGSAVVKSTNNDLSFNLASEKKGLVVPAGDYVLTYGTVTAGAETVRIRAGKMKPITVAAKATATPAWGGPIKAEFTWSHQDGVLTIRPQDLFFFGAAGEEYYDWKPDGQPPTFVVKDAKTGRELLKARFGGC